MNKKMTTIIVAGAFLVGGGFGSIGAAAPKVVTKTATPIVKTVTVPGPERIVTKNVPGPERIVIKNVAGPTKEVTPQGCIDALDIAQKVIEAVGVEHMEIGNAANSAADDGDMNAFAISMTASIKTMSGVVSGNTAAMGTAVAACRAN